MNLSALNPPFIRTTEEAYKYIADNFPGAYDIYVLTHEQAVKHYLGIRSRHRKGKRGPSPKHLKVKFCYDVVERNVRYTIKVSGSVRLHRNVIKQEQCQ